MIKDPNLFYDIKTGHLTGKTTNIIKASKKISNNLSLYKDITNLSDELLNSVNYEVEVYKEDENEGGLQFGTSYLYPGHVNKEFFMTKGHFHQIPNRTEFYLCIKGEGLLVYMNRSREWWVEKVLPNSLHYIPSDVAHRLVNTSDEILTVLACWNSDAGHDYESIESNGFPVRFFKDDSMITIFQD